MLSNQSCPLTLPKPRLELKHAIFEFSRYFLSSVIAVGVDLGLLIFLANYIHYTIAATISFIVGSIVHYLLAVIFVFHHRKWSEKKLAESVLFMVAGAGGLVVNVLVIAGCVEWFATSLLLAKMIAAGASFMFGYIVRKLVLF